MPFLKSLWVATLTSTQSESGSEAYFVVYINQNQRDVEALLSRFGIVDTGGGKLYGYQVPEETVIDPDNIDYIRIDTRGSDLWRPKVIAAWGERRTTGNVVPLGYDEEIDEVLSTDSSEGRISIPLRAIGRGNELTEINRVMFVTGTAGSVPEADTNYQTNSPVNVRITAGSTVVVDHTITDTPQSDFEQAQGNVYFLPVLSPFTRSQLADDSIVLSIQEEDAWKPIAVGLFGLDRADTAPVNMVPLVLEPEMGLLLDTGWLSADLSEGQPSVELPLAPIDP